MHGGIIIYCFDTNFCLSNREVTLKVFLGSIELTSEVITHALQVVSAFPHLSLYSPRSKSEALPVFPLEPISANPPLIQCLKLSLYNPVSPIRFVPRLKCGLKIHLEAGN